MINFLIHENKGELTEREMKFVVDLTVHNNPIMKAYPDKQEEYKRQAYEFYEQFIGMKSKDVIEKLITFNKTWDNYSLSVLFIFHYFKNFSIKTKIRIVIYLD